MKKILIFSLLIFGCTSQKSESLIPTQFPIAHVTHEYETSFAKPLYLFVIDSCEYIGFLSSSSTDLLTHKGNCRFCQKRNLTFK